MERWEKQVLITNSKHEEAEGLGQPQGTELEEMGKNSALIIFVGLIAST